MHRFVERTTRASIAWRALALLGLTLLAQPPTAARAEEPSVGVLLRRARFAIAAGKADEAATALAAARAREPRSRRGLEAALMLADLEFSRVGAAKADTILERAERDFPEGDAGAEIVLARGWLALARRDPTAALRHFGLVSTNTAHRFTTELAQLGSAWARMVAEPRPEIPARLKALAGTASEPALRVAAALTLARAHCARGEHKKALRPLRALRRVVGSSTFNDDLELSIGLIQLDMGAPAAARKTFQRLAALADSTTAAPPAVVQGLTLADLRLPPADFAARLTRLYAARKERSAGLLPFFAGTLDRPAHADAAAALALAHAALAARKEA